MPTFLAGTVDHDPVKRALSFLFPDKIFFQTFGRILGIRRYQESGVDDLGVGLLTEDLSEIMDPIGRFMATVAPLVRAAIPTRRPPAGRFPPGAPSPPE